MTRATLKDVALQAGVSYQTVSNVLNDHPSIRPGTRQRVLAAIRALDYHPNEAAKALRQSRVTTLCCAFFGHAADDIADPYRNLVQSAFIAEANAHGYSMTTAFLQPGQLDGFEALRQAFRQRRFGGAVVVGTTLGAAQVQTLLDWDLPAVLFDHAVAGLDVPAVTADYAGGMNALVEHHLAQGRRRLTLIIPTDDAGSSAVLRREAFVAAARAHGAEHQVVHSADWSYAAGEAAFRAAWAGDFRPEAVLVGSDRMAAGALLAARHLGLVVPQAVAVSGFDDFEFGRYTAPSLTTAHVPHGEMARLAVRTLLSHLDDPSLPARTACLPVAPVLRESA